ncbi:MAG: FHA domain-containing protein [Actinomycetota bacterium]|nr:FHA domain-containing protein [Actinomycetota bacterium]
MTPDSEAAPHAASPAELEEQLEAERQGAPFLAFRYPNGRQRLFILDESASRITVGRRSSADIWIDWDHEVSRLHAAFERVGDDWLLVDDGISSNGSFVNGERVTKRHRLRDGDTIRFGETLMTYRSPGQGDSKATNIRPR